MELMGLLPTYYENSEDITRLQSAFQYWITLFEDYKDDIFLQLNVNTATWGLELWEKQLGLEIDVSKSYKFRRERIKAKIRGIGTVTKQMIKEVASTYSNAEVEVIEDTANYCFKIKFIGTKGIPNNMADLKLTIEEIKPAHLAFTFEYTFNTWNDVRHLTWDEANAFTWKGLRERELNGRIYNKF